MSSTSKKRRLTPRVAGMAAGVAMIAAATQVVPAMAASMSGASGAAAPQAGTTVALGAAATAPSAQSAQSTAGALARDAYGDRGDLFAVTTGNQLYRFDRSGQGGPELTVAITGLAAGEQLVGIDTRPANGQLYGVGSTSRLYVIDPATGAASPVGPVFATPLSGKRFGVDFNPTVDRLRIVSDAGQNLRIDPTTGAVAGVDTALSYADGAQPGVTAAAYTNSVAGAANTALYDIDSARDILVLQGTKPGVSPVVSPNTGRLFPVGRLGIDVLGLDGFDIVGAAKGAVFDERDYTAVAAVQVAGERRSVLVRIDLQSGQATPRAKLVPGVVGLTSSAGAPRAVFATTAAGELVRFDRRTLQVASRLPITGLKPGEQALGIDVRPANGQLYLLGSTNQIYTVNPATAAATAVGAPFTPAVTGSLVGFDVNPMADRLRVVTTSGQNLRINPDTGAVAGVDTALAYDPNDRNAQFRSNVTHAAYTNNVVGAASTTLYDIDAALDVLATQNPPNNGTLMTVGRLRVDTDGVGGFDIAADGKALAALTPTDAKSSRIYSVDLTTGRARFVGQVGSGLSLTGLTVAPRGVLATS